MKNKKNIEFIRDFIEKNSKFILLPVIVIILILVVMIFDHSEKQKDTPVVNTETVSTESETETQPSSDAEMQPSEASEEETTTQEETTQAETGAQITEVSEEDLKGITELMNAYFKAKLDCDAAALYHLFGVENVEQGLLDSMTDDMKEDLKNLEDYRDISCYAVNGLTQDSYVVFTTFKIKYIATRVTAPCMTWSYVFKNPDGSYNISQNISEDAADFVKKVSETEKVQSMINKTNEKLNKVVESDENLKMIYEKYFANTDFVIRSETDAAQESTAQ